MKCVHTVAIAAILLLGCSSAYAQEVSDTEILLGAAAGAAIGSTIGNGDGRKIATVVGGLIGANMAREHARANNYGYTYGGNRFDRVCRDRIPGHYRQNSGVAQSWVNGCVARLQQRQADLEAQAYEEALNGPSN